MWPEAILGRTHRQKEAGSGPFDVCVFGGGIVGASIARDAALRGYRVLLLEARDYGQGTSSRSSKLVHGGVRYLEQGDIMLVAEALRERAILFASASHLVRPQRFLYPIVPGLTRPAWQVRFGLGIYDQLARIFTRSQSEQLQTAFAGHGLVDKQGAEATRLREFGLQFSSLCHYMDGQMDDSRLVIENIIDANNCGAVTLNYAKPISCTRIPSGTTNWEVMFRCEVSGASHTAKARFLVNATGPWVRRTHEMIEPWPKEWPRVIFSRGSHLLFRQDAKLPGVILPTGEKARYYFVLPYFSPYGASTLVGTTDREVQENEEDPQPSRSEIDELLGYLRRDLPMSGLNADSLYASFCGTRVLASVRSGASGRVSALSRREHYLKREHYVAILGGKYTTSRRMAERAVDLIDAHFGEKSRGRCLTPTRALPGGLGFNGPTAERLRKELFDEMLESIAIQTLLASPEVDRDGVYKLLRERARSAVQRFGIRVSEVFRDIDYDYLIDFTTPFLRSELEFIFKSEQPTSAEDILVRRFGLSYQPHDEQSWTHWVEIIEDFARASSETL